MPDFHARSRRWDRWEGVDKREKRRGGEEAIGSSCTAASFEHRFATNSLLVSFPPCGTGTQFRLFPLRQCANQVVQTFSLISPPVSSGFSGLAPLATARAWDLIARGFSTALSALRSVISSMALLVLYF